jgi:F0F1-type ATP synthase assembly protein I
MVRKSTAMSHPAVRFALPILAGALLGALMGYFGQCNSGTCPLTSTWWRGALYGAFLGFVLSLSSRSA